MQVFYCILLSVSFALCQQANNLPFKIAITSAPATVVAGTEVSITVSLTNKSDHDVDGGIMYSRGNLASIFRFEVHDEHGKLVPKRTYPHPELGFPFSVKETNISAGETLVLEQEVSALYDMQKPGKYTIQVWRRDPKYDIKSNIVTVTVTPKDKVGVRKSGKAR